MTPGVAFQGELGAYSEEAIYGFFGDDASPLPCREFRDVGDAVASGRADFGVLPLENSLAGTVTGSFDVLAALGLKIVGEVVSPIHHCLLGLPGASVGELRKILSHPVALAQCLSFLRAHSSTQAVAVYDTAGAAKEVSTGADRSVAAIAGRHAGERYGLEMLAENIEDRPDNQTRFAVVTRPGGPEAPRARDDAPRKSFLILETADRPGALVEVLAPFAEAGVNLSKLESRPGVRPWSYRFFLEVEADREEPAARDAFERCRRAAIDVRVLGSYPKWTGSVA